SQKGNDSLIVSIKYSFLVYVRRYFLSSSLCRNRHETFRSYCIMPRRFIFFRKVVTAATTTTDCCKMSARFPLLGWLSQLERVDGSRKVLGSVLDRA
uniref:Uncharacterized protein n=1 Tax=Romanomermis culicivorax TaxID=13658 RepID=A0A915KMT3_ROMCU